MKFETGILDVTRLVSNVLMIVLVAGNIFFSINYIENNRRLNELNPEDKVAADTKRIQTARFLKYFIETVLNTEKQISYEDRVKLENDVIQLQDIDVKKAWDEFVASKDGVTAQQNAVKLMNLLTSKLI